ncbi:hypothetical protein [Nocardia beijingensis]
MLEDLELGHCADSRPLVGGKRQTQDVDESGGWMAQIDEQSDDAGSRNQRDHSGHMVAYRKKAVRGVEFLFELGVGFDHRWAIFNDHFYRLSMLGTWWENSPDH